MVARPRDARRTIARGAHAGARLPDLRGAVLAARTRADRVLLAAHRPPLSATVEGARLSGYLRHKDVLDAVATDGPAAYATQRFLGRVRAGTVVVDGGAHLGLYTVLASRRASPGGLVIAIEPDPYDFAALERNVARNRLTNVRLVRRALVDAPGERIATSIDAELRVSRPLDLAIRLDVGGAEEQALAGAADSLRACARGTVVAMVDPIALADAGSSRGRLVELLSSYGYAPSFVDEPARALVPVAGVEPERKGIVYAEKR